MRKRVLPLLLLLCLLVPPLGAQAREISRLYVWDGDVELSADGSLPAGTILWHNRGNGYYLYLPSHLDPAHLRVYFTGGASSFTANGVTVENGSVTNVFVPGTTVILTNGVNSYSVTVRQSARLSTVYVKTKSGSINYIAESKKNKEAGSLYVVDQAGAPAFLNDFEYVRVRGNYSFYPYKKSFHIRLNESAPMLGMPSAKTWLLIASYADNSMIRNALTLDLAAAIGMANTSEYRFADVYVNGLYYGVYILCEKVQVQKNRINIADLEKATEAVNDRPLSSFRALGSSAYKRGTIKYYDIPNNPADITGGYLLQLELDGRYNQAGSAFVTAQGQSVLLKSPEYASKAQVEYIQSLVQAFENAIWAPDGIDPSTGKHYSEIADMPSLVGKYLIEEISKNVDGNKSSYYLYKYPDSVSEKLYFGPVWDYDIAYGNFSSVDYPNRFLTKPEGLLTGQDSVKRYYWFPQLYKHEDFRQAVREAYQNRMRPCLEIILGMAEPTEDTGGLMSLTAYEELLSAAADTNFARWRTFNADEFPVKTGASFHENIEHLRSFLTLRMAYLDSLWLE